MANDWAQYDFDQMSPEELHRFREAEAEKRIKRARVPKRFSGGLEAWREDFGADDETEARRRAKKQTRAWVNGFDPEGENTAPNIILLGPPGVGKSALASAVLSDCLRRYEVEGLFVDWSRLMGDLRAAIETKNPEPRQRLERLTEVSIAVIDDLAAGRGGTQAASPYELDILFSVVNTRYNEQRPTIITANASLVSLAQWSEERIVSRLVQDAIFVSDLAGLSDARRRK